MPVFTVQEEVEPDLDETAKQLALSPLKSTTRALGTAVMLKSVKKMRALVNEAGELDGDGTIGHMLQTT